MDNFLEQYPINTQIVVAWGEMDALQHVNNVVYFRYFETARIDFFKQINLLEQLKITSVGPVISENQARYKRPVTFPDTLTVGVSISDIKDDRFMMHYTVYSQSQQAVTTVGSSQVVMFNFKTGQKATLTPELIDALKTYEQA
ncbi:acyl-CoA thioesterase [Shewanella fidelis]|uniref:Thioesterase family protein n=1 Tax=Shewanella fidelis TaxID=173509 RepID=A0AAW8NV44_9GAMM|nr:thioesterase family protein [Shewanella fidelis]MDR8525784.1 thioesterase family protein [Shewanella fidelis]MDW4812707.1 thioesterase family protein [Shewanella fidelis]MDW4816455.1 thioesterase family protein [Shewanella fidelis]MDW4820381.1 thioesterase family protein [Shewanella fidelis]MDW4825171.1 thioesterase family protein [Shewanella fidelis]